MMGGGVTRKVFGGAVSALELAYGLARHVAWYLSYHVDGTTRDAEDESRKAS
jgi:hypothetical protein